MRSLLAALAVAAAALPLVGTAHASDPRDCLTAYENTKHLPPRYATVNADGSVTVDPHGGDAFLLGVAGSTVVLVTCIV